MQKYEMTKVSVISNQIKPIHHKEKKLGIQKLGIELHTKKT